MDCITGHMRTRLLLIAILVITGVACKHNKRANTTVRSRAAFDLLCPPNELALGVIDTEGARKLASQIAVYGCGQKAVYVYYPDTDTWVIDGAISEVPADYEIPELGEPSKKAKKSRKKAQKAHKKGGMGSGAPAPVEQPSVEQPAVDAPAVEPPAIEQPAVEPPPVEQAAPEAPVPDPA